MPPDLDLDLDPAPTLKEKLIRIRFFKSLINTQIHNSFKNNKATENIL